MDLKKAIMEATDGGITIFEKLFPFFHPRKSFKYDETEKTPSCKGYIKDGIYYVKCYDPERAPKSEAANCIDWYMHLHGITDFGEAVRIIAADEGISDSDGTSKIPPPLKITTLDEKGTYTGLRVIKSTRKPTEMECRWLGRYVTPKHCDELKIKFVESYTFTKEDGTVLLFESSGQYPVFYFEPERKIYEPKNKEARYRYQATEQMPEASTTLWGLAEATRRLEAYKLAVIQQEEQEDEVTSVSVKEELEDMGIQAEEDNAEIKKMLKMISERPGPGGKKWKLNQVIVCCGCRDAVNVLSMGSIPVWMSSEGIIIPRDAMTELQEISHEQYYMADLDSTGQEQAHKNCLVYLDLRRVYLPESLKELKDLRGKPCKDITDWCKHNEPWAFKNLLTTASPYKFWISQWSRPKGSKGEWIGKHKISRTWLKHFIASNGFKKFNFDDGKGFIHIDGNRVKKVTQEDIKSWVNEWAKDRGFSREILDMISGSRDMGEAVLNELPECELEFNTTGPEHQIMVFNEVVWKITPEKITQHKQGHLDCYVWAHRTGLREHGQVLNPRIKSGAKFYPDLINKKNSREFDPYFSIDISTSSVEVHRSFTWFNFLINTCRIHWKDEVRAWAELHGHADKSLSELQKLYTGQKDYVPAITSKYLTDEQNTDQQKHLINRIYTLGYLMHRHKYRNMAWLVWCMDYKVEKLKDSKGRSGKSLIPQAFEHMKMISTENGRDFNLTKKNHIFGDVTTMTDLLVINDCHEYLDLGYFFNYITDNITVNPKNLQQRIIPFAKAPKTIVTSNFGPNKLDDSTMDRILFNLFSDWYHSEKDFGTEWKPSNETGFNLFDDWDPSEWNQFFNYMAQCCHAYMNLPKCQPPMSQILLRQNMREAGDTFFEFAEDTLLPFINPHFVPDEDNRNMNGLIDINDNPSSTQPKGAYIIKKEISKAFKEYSGGKETITTNKLTDKIKAWASAKGIQVNSPDMFTPDKNGKIRLIRKITENRLGANGPTTTQTSVECIYLYSNDPIESAPKDEFEQILDTI